MAKKMTRKVVKRGRQIKLTPLEKIQGGVGIVPKRVRNLIDEYHLEQQQKKRSIQPTKKLDPAEVLSETINSAPKSRISKTELEYFSKTAIPKTTSFTPEQQQQLITAQLLINSAQSGDAQAINEIISQNDTHRQKNDPDYERKQLVKEYSRERAKFKRRYANIDNYEKLLKQTYENNEIDDQQYLDAKDELFNRNVRELDSDELRAGIAKFTAINEKTSTERDRAELAFMQIMKDYIISEDRYKAADEEMPFEIRERGRNRIFAAMKEIYNLDSFKPSEAMARKAFAELGLSKDDLSEMALEKTFSQFYDIAYQELAESGQLEVPKLARFQTEEAKALSRSVLPKNVYKKQIRKEIKSQFANQKLTKRQQQELRREKASMVKSAINKRSDLKKQTKKLKLVRPFSKSKKKKPPIVD